MLNFEDAEKAGSQAIDTALKSYSDAAKGVQAIAAETAVYSRKSFRDAVSHVETLRSAGSIGAAVELQATFARSCYENFVAEAARLGEMYAGLAKAVCTPYGAPAAPSASPADTTAAAA